MSRRNHGYFWNRFCKIVNISLIRCLNRILNGWKQFEKKYKHHQNIIQRIDMKIPENLENVELLVIFNKLVHLDGSPCSFYCSCIHFIIGWQKGMQKEGFGITSCVYDKKDNLFGDYSELIATVQTLVNSKCFMEFLCTCRYYIYEYNLTKKLYYIMVLCSTLRGIVYNISFYNRYCYGFYSYAIILWY